MRTIIISDAHGFPALIQSALDHAGFRQSRDRLVYAGDLVDRGPDPVGCFNLIDRLADTVVFGNHDVACALNLEINPYDPHARVLADRLRARALDTHGTWQLAAEVDGVIVTHAGVPESWNDAWDALDHDPRHMCEVLNLAFRAQLEAAIAEELTEWPETGVLGFDSPLWFRPIADGMPLDDARQVVGHTPHQFLGDDGADVLSGLGMHLIDPGAYRFLGIGGPRGHFRYAVIDQGEVSVHDASDSVTLAATGLRTPARRVPRVQSELRERELTACIPTVY